MKALIRNYNREELNFVNLVEIPEHLESKINGATDYHDWVWFSVASNESVEVMENFEAYYEIEKYKTLGIEIRENYKWEQKPIGYYWFPAGLGMKMRSPYYDTRINQSLIGNLNHPSGFQILVNSLGGKAWINVDKNQLEG